MNTQKKNDKCLYCGKPIGGHDGLQAFECGLKYGTKESIPKQYYEKVNFT